MAFCHCSKVPICPWSWGAPAQPKTSGTNLCGTAGPSWQVMIHENPSCVPVFANFCRAKLVQVSILPIKSSKHGWHRSKHIVTSNDLYPILHPVPLVSPRRNEGRPRRAEPGLSVRPRSRSQWRKSRPVPRWLEKMAGATPERYLRWIWHRNTRGFGMQNGDYYGYISWFKQRKHGWICIKHINLWGFDQQHMVDLPAKSSNTWGISVETWGFH